MSIQRSRLALFALACFGTIALVAMELFSK
jgi:hypothetical protein